MYIVMAILGFSLLVIVHELGHFIMAKVNGIKVEEFGKNKIRVIYWKGGDEKWWKEFIVYYYVDLC